jgi:hypothetical protein
MDTPPVLFQKRRKKNKYFLLDKLDGYIDYEYTNAYFVLPIKGKGNNDGSI